MKVLTSIYKYIIATIMVIIMFILSISSFFKNAIIEINIESEKTHFVSTFLPLYVLALLLFILLVPKLKNRICKWNTRKIGITLLIYDLILCIVLILLFNTREGADQAQVLYAAKDFVAGNFSKLAPNLYMGMLPYQLPLALLYEPFFLIFKDAAPFAWQFINAILICIIQYLLFHIFLKIFHKDNANVFLVLQFLDIPIILYVSFIYGTIPGMCLSLLAINLLLKFREDNRKKWLVLSVITMVAACLLRTNNIILLIAMSILLVLICMEKKRLLLLFIIPIMLGLFFGGRAGIYKLYELRSGMEVPKGEPYSLGIAMGLSENEERANGWYNGYTWDTYLELDCDYNKSQAFAKDRIKESLQKFCESPVYALSFFHEKNASMWLSPDLQGLWNNEHHGSYWGRIKILNSLFYGKLHTVVEEFLGLLQFFLYFLTFLYFLWNYRKLKWTECTFALIFIGGFLFHMIYEAKAQYILPYYVCLFPYASIALKMYMERLPGSFKEWKKIFKRKQENV